MAAKSIGVPDSRQEFLSAETKETKELLEKSLIDIKERKNEGLSTQLKIIFESPDLSRAQMLHGAIEEIVNSHNQKHPQKPLTILDVYTWIFGDSNIASQKIQKIKNSMHYTADKEWKSGAVEEKPYEEKSINISQSCDAFLEVIRNASSDKVDLTKLSDFFSYLQNLSVKGSTNHFEKIRSILAIGARKVQETPQKTDVFIKMIITSIKTILNEDPAFKNHPLFDEEHAKKGLLLDYKEQSEKPKEESQIMSNIDGEIKGVTVILSLDEGNGRLKGNYFNTLAQLLEAKSSTPNFILKCVYDNGQIKEEFKQFLQQKGISDANVVFIPRDLGGLSFWARDGAVRKSDGTIVEPKSFRNGDDGGLGQAYKTLTPVEGTDLQRSNLYFEGGNMRAIKNILFVGYEDIERTMKENPMFENDEQKVIKAFEQEFGKKVIVIGEKDKKQPVFHIDMFLTPLGDNTIMVADSIDSRTKDALNKISKDLSEQGFNVVRIPFFSRYVNDNQKGSELFITYNNAIIERYSKAEGSEAKKIYLPQYYGGGYDNPTSTITVDGVKVDLETMNKKAVEIYQSQGFEVVPIQFPTQISALQGALNCITFEERN